MSLPGIQGPVGPHQEHPVDLPSFIKTEADLQELQVFLNRVLALAKSAWEQERNK